MTRARFRVLVTWKGDPHSPRVRPRAAGVLIFYWAAVSRMSAHCLSMMKACEVGMYMLSRP